MAGRRAKAVGDKCSAKAAEPGVAIAEAQVRQAATLNSLRALMMIRAYRMRGHLEANLDPLGSSRCCRTPSSRHETYGFTEADLDRPIFLDYVLGLETATAPRDPRRS